jgi:hypothetical protein
LHGPGNRSARELQPREHLKRLHLGGIDIEIPAPHETSEAAVSIDDKRIGDQRELAEG